jgi:hypothetical protein
VGDWDADDCILVLPEGWAKEKGMI